MGSGGDQSSWAVLSGRTEVLLSGGGGVPELSSELVEAELGKAVSFDKFCLLFAAILIQNLIN